MPHFLRSILFCCLIFTCTTPAQAHRVHIFAIVEGSEIAANCRFSKAKPAQKSLVQVFNAKDNSLLLEGRTDRQGNFRFPIPKPILQNPVDLRLELDAGAGHQATWVIEAAEIALRKNLAPHLQKAKKSITEISPTTIKKDSTQLQLTAQQLQEIINRSLDTKLAPIHQMLMAQQTDDPGFAEIVGGIGWVFGLFGIFALIKRQRNKQDKR